MPDKIFGAARIRGYQVLETRGIYETVGIQVLDRVVAGYLWLPFSLIEIGFRNAVDRVVTANHPRGENWLITDSFAGGTIAVASVISPPELRHARAATNPQQTANPVDLDDAIGDAARMAGRQPTLRSEISRDDLIAHLMMGFWVTRCASIFGAGSESHFWTLLTNEWPQLDMPQDELARKMSSLNDVRNRIAHHEPLVIRRGNIYTRRGDSKAQADLIVSLGGALDKFERQVGEATRIAQVIVPPATARLSEVPKDIHRALQPLREALRAAEDARKAEKAKRTAP